MSIILKGVIKDGQISLPTKLDLPEGKEVTVRVEDVAETEKPLKSDDLSKHPFVGMWADRTDLPDSVTYVQEMRKKWSNRYPRGS